MPEPSVLARSAILTTPWCNTCQLRQQGCFGHMADAELAFMGALKSAHSRKWAGEFLVEQGASKPRLLTLYSGWAIKTSSLSSGESHLACVLLPGDIIGLDTLLCGPPHHSVQAVTDVTYCTLDHRQFDALLQIPALARGIARVLAHEQQRISDRLAVVGACGARRNVAHFLLDLFLRLRERQMARDDGFRMPLTATQISSAVGLTTVHLHRVLRGLRQDGVLTLEQRAVTIHDMAALHELATPRPGSPPTLAMS